MIEEKAKELGLELYVPTFENDLKLFKWWMELQNSADFERIFTSLDRPLSKFMQTFEPPCILVFTCNDSDEINHAIWFTPFADTPTASFVGYWAHKSIRSSRHAYAVTKFVYDAAFQIFKTLVGITKHENLLRIHRKLGYNIVGQIPHFMEDEDAWVVYLTKENFKNSKFYQMEK